MGIQTTRTVSREFAIDRITKIYGLVQLHNYIEIEEITNEDLSISLEQFVDEYYLTDIGKFENIRKWTNRMLEDMLDRPFFRESMFDNYFIEG